MDIKEKNGWMDGKLDVKQPLKGPQENDVEMEYTRLEKLSGGSGAVALKMHGRSAQSQRHAPGCGREAPRRASRQNSTSCGRPGHQWSG